MVRGIRPVTIRNEVRGLARARTPEALSLAALFAGAALCLLMGVLFPLSASAPVRLGTVMLVVALVMSTGTLWVGHRLPPAVLVGEAVVAVVLNSVIVAESRTTGGALADAFAYLWLTAWVALFFPRAAVPFAALSSAGFGTGLLLAGLPGMAVGWGMVTVAIAMIAVLVGRVSRILRRHLRTDALTGTLNRSGLAEAAERVPRRRRRVDEITVVALDLDGFKAVNDGLGHAAGDRLLADAAAAWRRALRESDVLARMGGDEFVVVMPGTSEDEAAAVLDRLRRSHPVPWSAGITRWRAGESLDACLERADAELYAAKADRP